MTTNNAQHNKFVITYIKYWNMLQWMSMS